MRRIKELQMKWAKRVDLPQMWAYRADDVLPSLAFNGLNGFSLSFFTEASGFHGENLFAALFHPSWRPTSGTAAISLR